MRTKEDVRPEIKELLKQTYFGNPWQVESFLRDIAKEMVADKMEAYKKESEEKYLKGKESRAKAKTKQIEKGEQLKKELKPGMVIKCRGTRDRDGMREVLDIESGHVVCRKLRRTFDGLNLAWRRDEYITTHNWDKVVEIRPEKILN